MRVGNVVVRTITLANGTAVEKYPEDTDTALTNVESSRPQGMILHSRNGFDLRVSFATGEDAAGNFLTVEAGLYLDLPSDIDLSRIYVRSTNVGGDVVEILTSGSMVGVHISAGPG